MIVHLCREVSHASAVSSSDTEAQLTIRSRNGTEQEISLPALQGDGPYLAASENWSVLVPTEVTATGRWPHVLDLLNERPDIYRKAGRYGDALARGRLPRFVPAQQSHRRRRR